MVEAQGGDPSVVAHPDRLARAPLATDFVAPTAGWLAGMQTNEIGCAAMVLGAGRECAEDRIDPGAGLTMRKRIGDRVEAGEPLCSLRASTEARLQAGVQRLAGVFTIAGTPPAPRPLVRKVIRSS
jgi:thymidine phosphorylase